MSCEYATWDGSYVLGALSPADREAYERHLETCRSCAEAVRELAGLPGLLSRVDERTIGLPVGPVPESLLPHLVGQVRRERRRRMLAVAGIAAAVLAVAGGAVGIAAVSGPDTPAAGPAASGSPTPGPTGSSTLGSAVVAMEPVGGAPVQGWLALETVPWGTRLSLRCSYPSVTGGYEGGQEGGYDGATSVGYVLVVRTRDGGEQQVATWNAVPGRSMDLQAATATGRDDIALVEVRTDAGRPVLRLAG
jgi:hypothetical protein